MNRRISTRSIALGIAIFGIAGAALGLDAFVRPPTGNGVFVPCAWVTPDGSDSDTYAYDSFITPRDEWIKEVWWRGNGNLTPNDTFKVTFFESIAGGYEPHIDIPETEHVYLYRASTTDLGGQTYVGLQGGVATYEYHLVLPQAFHASAGVKYWVKILANTYTFPSWGICAGQNGVAGGDGRHFRYITGLHMFQWAQNDTAFTLKSAEQYALPTDFQVATGLHMGGSLASLSADDDDKLALLLDENDPNSEVVFTASARTSTPIVIRLDATVSSTRSDVGGYTDAYDFAASSYVPVDFRLIGTIDQPFSATLPAPYNRFVSGFGALQARHRSIPTADISAFDGWTVSIDRFVWEE